MVETLSSIGESLKISDGLISEEALKLRLSEQYIKALDQIFKEADIVVLPKDVSSKLEAGQGLDEQTLQGVFNIFRAALGLSDLPVSPQ